MSYRIKKKINGIVQMRVKRITFKKRESKNIRQACRAN